ncbi:DUF805 domain-containing protein [Trinickia violacea]|uniref:DUF805 domain-containing protein n=1 Tax=Trinickia violacea TaxID=2571746 RepID=A0A4P8IJZ0_9BURK|nr:DUF805 domain-containing protein [Trinickia violacea]QCP47997.1 DUF805 domain-containing protein [Trinickia violacea]
MHRKALRSVIGAWLRGYRNIFRFSGRETRVDFLVFLVVHYCVFYAATRGVLCFLSGENASYQVALFIIGLFSLLATLSYNVRRLHDSNRSGLLCIGYFLFAAPIVIVVSLALPPQNATNLYGPDPREGRE